MSSKPGPVILGFGTSTQRSPAKFSEPAHLDKRRYLPAEQKTTWLSSLKMCEKNNAENEKLNAFLQAMDILDYF